MGEQKDKLLKGKARGYNVYLPLALADKITTRAEILDRSFSWLVKRVLADYLSTCLQCGQELPDEKLLEEFHKSKSASSCTAADIEGLCFECWPEL